MDGVCPEAGFYHCSVKDCVHAVLHRLNPVEFCEDICLLHDGAGSCQLVQLENQVVGDPTLITSSAIVPEFVRKLEI